MSDHELHDAELSLERFVRAGAPDADGGEPVTLVTTRGDISIRYYSTTGAAKAGGTIFFGCTDGPEPSPGVAQLYRRACRTLAAAGVAGIVLAFRRPRSFHECVLDVLGAMAFFDEEDAAPVALVGHSLAAAAAVQVALLSPDVAACALLSAVPFEGADEFLPHLGPRCALLFVHGTADVVVPTDAARAMFEEASEPKGWLDASGGGHDLDALDDRGASLAAQLAEWVRDAVGRPGVRAE